MYAVVGTYKQLADDPQSWCPYVILMSSLENAEIATEFILNSQKHLDDMFYGFDKEERTELFNDKVNEFKKTTEWFDEFQGAIELVEMIIIGDEYDCAGSAEAYVIKQSQGLVFL